MKKIMFVCQSLGSGGAERVVSVLSDTLAESEYEIYILALNSTARAYEVDERVHVIFPENRLMKGIAGKLQRIKTIRREIIRNKIDVVIAFSHYNAMFAVIATKGLKIKVIGSERNDPGQLKKRRIVDALRRILYRKLDSLVCQTEEAKAYFPKNIQKKSVVILNPISNNLPKSYNGEREKRIVTFCRLEPQKNIPMLIDAFGLLSENHPEYVLEIYGEGSEKENILKYIAEKKVNDKVLVRPFMKNIHEQVVNAAMFVLTSNYEGLSNSMIEAMAIGLPTIVTDCPCGGARTVIKNGFNGLLVPVGDTHATFRAMQLLIEEPKKSEELSRNGAKIKNSLDKEKIAEQWIAVIEG